MGVCAFGERRLKAPPLSCVHLLCCCAPVTTKGRGIGQQIASQGEPRQAAPGEIICRASRPGLPLSDPSRNARRRCWPPARRPGRCWRGHRRRGKEPVPCCTPCPRPGLAWGRWQARGRCSRWRNRPYPGSVSNANHSHQMQSAGTTPGPGLKFLVAPASPLRRPRPGRPARAAGNRPDSGGSCCSPPAWRYRPRRGPGCADGRRRACGRR